MTGGFSTTIRGIEIDVTTTLNNYYDEEKEYYTKEEFDNYLSEIGLINEFHLSNCRILPWYSILFLHHNNCLV